MTPAVSIRAVLLSLGALSIVIAAGLAGFGLLGMQQQLDARERTVTLECTLLNHNTADTYMGSVRTDVLRALQRSLGTNKESAEFIRAELRQHIEVLTSRLQGNLNLSLPADLMGDYQMIAGVLPTFVRAGQDAVELALRDPIAGATNFERFRQDFSSFEQLMNDVRETVQADLTRVRAEAWLTAQREQWDIKIALMSGILLLALITWAAVRVGQRIASDLAVSQEEARRLSQHDKLTGLPNRAFLAERLEQDLAFARRTDAMLAMLCLDLDRFKQVNDTLGHHVGDELLRAVAARLRSCVRRSDTVARLGGDEFAIIQCPLGAVEEAGALASRLIGALSEPYRFG